ncbi:unnamed protein product [Nezara viridula]|uniref:Protein msta n=1 Tax=Nezara viridula TaxID=85310 RepID=A0A9P0MLI0_NEZVI|nr:unnamed protein product [Nezara viridula]
MLEPVTCKLCGKQSKQKCAGCLSVSYCSREHQKLDWSSHKNACCSFTINEVAGMGRCLTARREIRVGEVVLRERPLASGPPQVTGPVCLGCLNGLQGPGVDCPRCGWPMCSSACAASPGHRPECHWAQVKRKEKVKISNFTTPHPTYACITPLRLLYAKHTDSKLWAKISSLESHPEERKKDGKWEQERFAVAKLLRRFYKLEEEVTEDEILEICGIIQINGHEVPLSEPGTISLYWKGSLLEHNCRPNCSKSFTESGDLLIRAAVAISRGERLSICYTDALWGSPSRMIHLQQTKYFQCRCKRCSDVTEFGTYFSAISCTDSDCKGKLLPPSFFNLGSNWSCSKCSSSVDESRVTEVLSKVAVQLVEVDKKSATSCKNFLQSTRDLLPENHFQRVEVKLALVQLIGQSSGGLATVSDEWLTIKESLARELIALSALLFPAECRLRGVVYFELHAAVAERARREASRGGDTSVPEHLLETRNYLESSISQLKYEPQSLPEGKICKQGIQNLKDLDKLLQAMNVSTFSSL